MVRRQHQMWLPLWSSRSLRKNCSALKRKVQSLIRERKLKFEESDGPVGVEYSSGTKAKMTRQEKGAPREAVSKKAAMPEERVPITKTGRSETDCSLTTEGSKERSCKPNERQEKNTFQGSTQGLKRMPVKRNECEEQNLQTLKRRRILKGNEAWDGQIANVKNENTGISIC